VFWLGVCMIVVRVEVVILSVDLVLYCCSIKSRSDVRFTTFPVNEKLPVDKKWLHCFRVRLLTYGDIVSHRGLYSA
jgi:hypothetical protein